MADSRRIMTKYKAAATLWLNGTQDSVNFIESGDTALQVGYPAYAFRVANIIVGNLWAAIWARVLSETPGYPTTAIDWQNTSWLLKEHTVQCHNGYGTYLPPLQRTSTGYVLRVVSANMWEGMYVSFYHQVEVKNNSMMSVTIKVKDMNDTITFADGSDGSVEPTTSLSAETEFVIASGGTKLVTGFEPLQIKFDNDAIGGGYDFSVTDQNGNTSRISAGGTGGLTLSTADGSIINTPVTSGLLNEDDGQIVVGDYLTVTEGSKPIFADIGTGADSPLFANIGDSIGKPLFAAIIEEEAEPGAPDSIPNFADITIDWSDVPNSDLDCLGYWTDLPDQQIGWSYGAGSVNDPYKAVWQGDNTNFGPEYIQVGVNGNEATGVTTRTYQIHLNYYRLTYSGHLATVTVAYGGVTLYKTINPTSNTSQPATISSPSVLITFNADGTPASIA